jgi:hypothetical protein
LAEHARVRRANESRSAATAINECAERASGEA